MSTLKKIGFLFFYIIPSLVVIGYYLGGWWLFSGFIFAYGLIPLLDEIVGKDPENIDREWVPVLSKELYFDYILHSLVYIQLAICIWAAYVLSQQTLSNFEYVGFLLSFMTLTSGGINIAHELGHKKTFWPRFNSKLNLMMTGYMHFYIEHNQGHHVRVATPEDPATSRKGQSYYAFWVQSVIGGFLSAWNIEKRRLERRDLALWNPIYNRMLQFIIFPLLFCTFLTWIGFISQGQMIWAIPIFFFSQSVLAFSSLEAVNYVEHYGMQRKEIRPGKYERVNPLHSWNSNHMISNFLLFQLQRHSDHHAFAARPYQVLRHFEVSPQLPTGYPVMILTALVPPLWFWVMDKRLAAWQSKTQDEKYTQAALKAVV